MNSLNLNDVNAYVNEHIVAFHQQRLSSLQQLTLPKLVRKNPYLFRAKNVNAASELITGLLDAFLSSSEEKLFGDFLEHLAIFVAERTSGGQKSSAQGVDLEFHNDGIHYLVSVKSGPSWGNSSQHTQLERDLKNAVARVKQLNRGANVEAVLGICYGKTKTSRLRGYLKVVGQNFWYLISENRDLYIDIIEPIGYRAKQHNDAFDSEKDNLTNRLTKSFIERYCTANGAIDWVRFVQANSGNYDLDRFF
ncbi:MAG: cytosolic protein [Chloroflexi bacterium]|nr:cytosolic protein [Chloroflexota bacterium]